MAGKKGMRSYPLSIRLAAVKMHLEDGATKKEVLEHFNICNDSQLETWCRRYKEYGEMGLAERKRGRPRKGETRDIKSTEKPLWKMVQRLEMENELLKNYQLELRRWLYPELPTKSSKD